MMSAKLLMGLSEENPELERQIGCLTGIFQVFDRHHLITGRRLSGQSPRRLPPGTCVINLIIILINHC